MVVHFFRFCTCDATHKKPSIKLLTVIIEVTSCIVYKVDYIIILF